MLSLEIESEIIMHTFYLAVVNGCDPFFLLFKIPYHIIDKKCLKEGKRVTPTWFMSVEIAGAERAQWKLMK
jgi:hypothetical protein